MYFKVDLSSPSVLTQYQKVDAEFEEVDRSYAYTPARPENPCRWGPPFCPKPVKPCPPPPPPPCEGPIYKCPRSDPWRAKVRTKAKPRTSFPKINSGSQFFSGVGNSLWKDFSTYGIAAKEGHDPKVKEGGKKDAGVDVANGARDGGQNGTQSAKEGKAPTWRDLACKAKKELKEKTGWGRPDTCCPKDPKAGESKGPPEPKTRENGK